MKYLYASLFFLFVALQGTAQTLHFVLFADTNDESIGKAVQKSKDLHNRLQQYSVGSIRIL